MANGFARRVLSDFEFQTWKARSARWPERGVRYLATRFSAKEALQQSHWFGYAHAYELALVRNPQPGQWQTRHRAARRTPAVVSGPGPASTNQRQRRNRLRRQLLRLSKLQKTRRSPFQQPPQAPATMTQHAPLIIDIAGLTLSKTDRQRLQHPLVGGMILFARNWQSRTQLRALCQSIKKVRSDLLICVDHEGGRVQRFKTDGFTHLPPMRPPGRDVAASPASQEKSRTAGRHQCRHRLRLCAGCGTACLWRGFELHPGTGPGLWQQRRDWRPRLCPAIRA